MRFSSVLGALGAFASLPLLSVALTVGDVTRQSITAFAQKEVAKRSLLSDVLTDIEHLTECASCEVSEAGQKKAAMAMAYGNGRELKS
jgi:hypothetical protein